MEFAKRLFSLERRMWGANIVNVLALAAGPYSLLSARKADGVSLPMFFLFLFIQATYLEHGWREKKRRQFCGAWGSPLSAPPPPS